MISTSEGKMKAKRIGTGIMALTLTLSLCACKPQKKTETEESSESSSSKPTTQSDPSETTSEPSVSDTTEETTVQTSVEDESEEPIVIYGYEKGFQMTLQTYLPDLEVEYVYVKPEEYYKTLQEALSGEEKVPDLFMMDAEHLQEWTFGGQALSIDQLGISSSELSDQFPYTYQLAENAEGSIFALAYDLSPSCVIYNRALAKETLGSGDPADMAERVRDWGTILDSARLANMNSEGTIKLLADRQQVHRLFWAAHTEEWVKDGQVQVGNDLQQYFMLQETLLAESLTGEKEWNSREWRSDLATGQAVMFFGSLNTAADVIGYVPGHEEKEEPKTSSEDETSETSEEEIEETGWAILPAPTALYDGGTWLMASASTDKKATCAQILRLMTLDEKTMTDLAVGGKFVNSIKIMSNCADDPNFISDFLNGQNPYAVLVPEALKIQVPANTEVDKYVDSEIKILLQAYLDGEIETFDEVKEQFIIGLEELLALG